VLRGGGGGVRAAKSARKFHTCARAAHNHFSFWRAPRMRTLHGDKSEADRIFSNDFAAFIQMFGFEGLCALFDADVDARAPRRQERRWLHRQAELHGVRRREGAVDRSVAGHISTDGFAAFI
jgi:hypothetical protein